MYKSLLVDVNSNHAWDHIANQSSVAYIGNCCDMLTFAPTTLRLKLYRLSFNQGKVLP